MNNDFFVQNPHLLEKGKATISNEWFKTFVSVHCGIERDIYKRLSAEDRLVAAVRDSTVVWTAERFEAVLKAIDTLRAHEELKTPPQNAPCECRTGQCRIDYE